MDPGLAAVWPQISYLIPLSLGFLICQRGLLTAATPAAGRVICIHARGTVGVRPRPASHLPATCCGQTTGLPASPRPSSSLTPTSASLCLSESPTCPYLCPSGPRPAMVSTPVRHLSPSWAPIMCRFPTFSGFAPHYLPLMLNPHYPVSSENKTWFFLD